MTARTRFIISHGVIPWGLLGGAAAGVGVVHSISSAERLGQPPGILAEAVIVVLTCLVWVGIVGWLVGAVRWAIREMPRTDRR